MKTFFRVLMLTASISGVVATSFHIAQAQSSAQQKAPQIRQQRALRIVAAARSQVGDLYDQSYYSLPYPSGDVPRGRGACTEGGGRSVIYAPNQTIRCLAPVATCRAAEALAPMS